MFSTRFTKRTMSTSSQGPSQSCKIISVVTATATATIASTDLCSEEAWKTPVVICGSPTAICAIMIMTETATKNVTSSLDARSKSNGTRIATATFATMIVLPTGGHRLPRPRLRSLFTFAFKTMTTMTTITFLGRDLRLLLQLQLRLVLRLLLRLLPHPLLFMIIWNMFVLPVPIPLPGPGPLTWKTKSLRS